MAINAAKRLTPRRHDIHHAFRATRRLNLTEATT